MGYPGGIVVKISQRFGHNGAHTHTHTHTHTHILPYKFLLSLTFFFLLLPSPFPLYFPSYLFLFISTLFPSLFLFHFVCVLALLQSWLTLSNPMDCSLTGSSVHGILQARILEWVANPFFRGSS